jgi:DNA-directed RNA polymerase specialized sigma24 family protein
MHRTTVLSYIRATSAGTYLSVDPSGAAPGVVLQTASSSAGPRGDEEGAVPVTADDVPSRAGADLDPGEFLINHRADWLGYALAHARNLQDAEDAVSDVGVKILQQYAETGTLCPPGYDPVAWSKTVIAHYIYDLHRRDDVRLRYQQKLHNPQGDFVDDLLDQMIIRQALPLIRDLKPSDHQIAKMHYEEGLAPINIARALGRNVITVRTSLWRTNRKIRRWLGITSEPQRVISRETA